MGNQILDGRNCSALAVFDILYLIFLFLDSIGQVLWPYYTGAFPNWYLLTTPHILYPGKAISLTCSVFLMVSIALERYMAVYYPFSRIPFSNIDGSRKSCFKKRLFIYIFPAIFFSILLNVFKFFESKVDVNEEEVKLEITALRYNPTYISVNSWIRLILLGVLPMTAVILLNCCIYVAVRRASNDTSGPKEEQAVPRNNTNVNLRRRLPHSNTGARIKTTSELRLSIVLLLIAVIFIFSSLPRITIMMWDIIIINDLRVCIDEGYLGRGFPFWNQILGNLSHVLLCAVPTANFFVYCLVGNKFRQTASSYLCAYIHCSKPQPSVISPIPGSLRSSLRITTVSGGERKKEEAGNLAETSM